jgi:hypothetical protein
MVIAFANRLRPECTFYDLHSPEQIIPFLDTKRMKKWTLTEDGLPRGIII